MKRLSKLWTLAHVKPALFLPLIALICALGGAIFWYVGPKTQAAAPPTSPREPKPVLFSKFLDLIEFPDELQFSVNEATELATILSQADAALVVSRSTRPDRDRARRELKSATLGELEAFLQRYPQSGLVPVIRDALARQYRADGRFSRAMNHWAEAWTATANSDGKAERLIADRALAETASLYTSLGRIDDLAPLIRAYQFRVMASPRLAQIWARAMEAYFEMVNSPGKAYRCGTFALDNASRALSGKPFEGLWTFPSSINGFTLAELTAMSEEYGLDFVPAVRSAGAPIIFPAVVHWKQNHYAAIKTYDGERGLVEDPTFGTRVWMEADAIEEEASGYFMIPRSVQLPEGWRYATGQELLEVYGKGYPYTQDDNAPPQCEEGDDCCVDGPSGTGGDGPQIGSKGGSKGCAACGGKSGGGSWGMATWTVHEPQINLMISDIPMPFETAFGPEFVLKLGWKQRNVNDWTGLGTFGGGWESELLSYVVYYDPWSGLVDSALDLYRGDGFKYMLTFEANETVSNQDFVSGMWAVRTVVNDEVTAIDIYYKNGAVDHYGLIPSGSFYRLESRQDATSKAMTFTYDDPSGIWGASRLVGVTMADGSQFSVNYDYPVSTVYDYYRITEVTGPDNRSVTFGYIETNSVTVLTSITDVVGIVSSFTYDTTRWWINSMTAPYGTTSFTQEDNSYCDLTHMLSCSGIDRSVIIREPGGAKQAYAFYDNLYEFNNTNEMAGKIPLSFDASQIPIYVGTNDPPIQTLDTERNKRNSHYWGRQQAALLSTTNLHNLTAADYLVSRTKHWLVRDDQYIASMRALSWELPPSPDQSAEALPTFYDYAGKPSGTNGFWREGSRSVPNVISRRMPDGSTHYRYLELNSLGMKTSETERWEDGGVRFRTNQFIYATGTTNQAINDLVVLQEIENGHLKFGRALHATYPEQIGRETNALGEVTIFDYDANRRLTTKETPAGLLTTYTYDGTSHHLASVVDSISGTPVRTNLYSWEYGQLKTHTDERGLNITNHYDKLNRLTVREFPDGSYIQNVYYLFPGQSFTNGNGTNILDVTASRDQLGNWTYFEYTPLRQIAKVTNPLNVSTVYEYCACGGPTTIREAYGTTNEFVTSQSFDYQGRLNYVFKPGGISVTNLYDSMGRLVIRMDALGATTNWYDNLGRLVIVSNAFGQVQKSIYDDHDLVRTNIDANGVSTIMAYDDLHRIESQTLVGGGTNSWGYTANIAFPTSYTNELGKVTEYGYNSLGWKLSEVFVGVATNSFTYNAAGDLRTLSDGKSQVTKWGYDTFGRVTSKTNAANTEILRYSYHLNGALSNRWSAAKGNTVYSYDAAGNLTNVNYATSSDLIFEYDSLNRPSMMTNVLGKTIWTYDVTNRFSVEDGPWADDAVTNRWNTAGLTESISVDQPSTTNFYWMAYTYDAARRLKTISGTAGNFTNYYISGLNSITTPSTLVQQRSLPNTAFITNQFDSLARLIDSTLRHSSAGTNINSHAYLYNLGHQRTNQTRLDGDVDYLYDDVGQLTSAKSYDAGGSEVISQRRGYQYDAAWNLTNHTIVFGSARQVNNLNQVTNSASHGAYTYDSNGNRITADSTRFYQYDDENQLIVYYTDPAIVSTAAKKTEFTYDGRGRLRRRIEYSYLSGWTQDSDTRYIYSGMLCIQERSSSNTPTVSYTVGSDLSGTLEGAGGIGGLLARTHGYSSGAWSTHNFYHADGNGNITAMVDSAQSLVASYKYDPYGNSFAATGTLAGANQFRFSSKGLVSPLGLYYYPYRFYDPSLQRWLNTDPLGEKGFELSRNSQPEPRTAEMVQGPNLYCFVRNSPVHLIDPLGLALCEADCDSFLKNCMKDVYAGYGTGTVQGLGYGFAGAATALAIGSINPIAGVLVGGAIEANGLREAGNTIADARARAKDCQAMHEKCMDAVDRRNAK
jgi:RHS repeat-associated protein